MDWKLALMQHPMYFIIKEDRLCAERTPPWGAPDIGSYVQRLRDNLAVVRDNPHLKIGFEWSGLELELLAQDAPDVLSEMLALAAQGQLTFYNGTYSQPHLQILSAEANYRQFEAGARVYRQLGARPVLTYAHQETSFNEQTPQLLKAFGIRYMIMPHFIATLVLEEAELIYHAREGTMFVHGSEFAAWRGLDGTTIPTYLQEPPHRPLPDWLALQAAKGWLHVPPIVVESPDLVAIDEAWLAERAGFEFVLLDEALPERLRRAPPRFRARLYANWSYVEGIRAEELSRANWRAEHAALRAEALCVLAFVLVGRPAASTESIWKTILKTQHHDVYCFCAPDLKGKAVAWLHEAEQQAGRLAQAAAEALLGQVGDLRQDAQQLIVINTLPQAVAGPVTVEVAQPNPAVFDSDHRPVACEAAPAGPGLSRLTFIARGRGLGYRSYYLGGGGPPAQEETLAGPLTFDNAYYQAVVHPDGTLAALRLKPGGRDLLDTRQVRGNQLAASDSTGLGSRHEGTTDVSRPQPRWDPVAPGPALYWEPEGEASLRRSALGVTLTAPGRMGSRARAIAIVRLFDELPWIDLTWEFEFDQASLGSFYADETKLRVQWPLGFHPALHHDLAFGVTGTLAQRPFFPAGWVDASDGDAGLAYLHQGTPKHWLDEDVLVNLLAWGEDTDAIGNRLGVGRWPKTFDQRLNGRHTIHAAVYPHAGDWRAADVAGVARAFNDPPLAFVAAGARGSLPPSLEVFELLGADLHATALTVEAGQVVCRLYSTGEQPQAVGLRLSRLRPVGLAALTGEPLAQLGPFQIAHLQLERDG